MCKKAAGAVTSRPIQKQFALTETMRTLVSEFRDSSNRAEYIAQQKGKISGYDPHEQPLITHLLNLMQARLDEDEGMMNKWLSKLIPQVSLHLHLDGSLDPAVIGDDHVLHLSDDGPVTSQLGMADFFPRFFDQVVETHMQTEEELVNSAYSLVKRAHATGLVHIEIRVAPMLHTEKDLEYSTIVKAIMTGLEKGYEETGVTSAAVFAMYRNKEAHDEGAKAHSVDTAKAVVDLAEAYTGPIGIGVDIVGLEHIVSAEFSQKLSLSYQPFVDAIRLIHDHNASQQGRRIGVTPHAGEMPDSGYNVKTAVETYKADRIGHGIHGYEHIPKGTVVEVNPVSNVVLANAPSLAEHPLPAMVQAGCMVALSADDWNPCGGDESMQLVRLNDEIGYHEATGLDFHLRDQTGDVNPLIVSFQKNGATGAFVVEDRTKTTLSDLIDGRVAVLNELLSIPM